jgi:hypothetical protein
LLNLKNAKLDMDLKERCEEISKLKKALAESEALHYQRERDLKKKLQQDFEIIEQELEAARKYAWKFCVGVFIYLVIREALADKEHQLITLMENRLDVQEHYYKGKLAEKSADAGVGFKIFETKYHCSLCDFLQCSTEYIKTLENAVLQWEEYIKECMYIVLNLMILILFHV